MKAVRAQALGLAYPVHGSAPPPAASAREFVGTSRFVVERRLGSGGMGVVFEAFDRERDARVALKTLTRVDALAIARLKGEFRLLADVLHPNLIQLHELFCEEGQWFFTMEVVRGVSFYEYVRPYAQPPSSRPPAGDAETLAVVSWRPERAPPDLTTGAQASPASPPSQSWLPSTSPRSEPEPQSDAPPLDVDRLRHALGQLVVGVAAVHRAQRLHRDLKPANVLVGPDGALVILDFGIAAAFDGGADDAIVASYIAGTPQYIAPEYLMGGLKSPAMDWFGVGVMLYQALVGALPFDGTVVGARKVPTAPREIDPTLPADLSALAMRLISLRPEDRPSGAEIMAALGLSTESVSVDGIPIAAPEGTFVGRDGEIAAFLEAAKSCRNDRAVAVCLSAPAGGGKTALTEHVLAHLAEQPGAIVLQGRCYERESVPFKAFDELIDVLSGVLRRLPADVVAALLPADMPALVRVFPAFARVAARASVSLAEPDNGDALDQRRAAFAAFRSLLAKLAQRGPLVVAIDDVHWGDTDSAALLLELLADRATPAPFLVLGYRSEDASSSPVVGAIDGFARRSADRVRHLALRPLGHDDARRLAREILHESRIDDEALATHVAREASGNPLFLGELARHAISAARGESPTPVEGLSLVGVLRARVDHLRPDARRLLETVAVAGHPISARLAATAAGLSASATDDHVAMLRAAKLLRSGGPRRGDTIEAFHDRVRETVASDVEARESARIHLALAEAMERQGADPEALALHLRAGGERRRAAGYAATAAKTAAAALAFDHAARLYRLALDLALELAAEDGAPTDSARVLSLREGLGSALYNGGRGAEAAPELLAAAGEATSVEAIELRRRAAEAWLMTGRIHEGLTAARDVLDRLGVRLYRSTAESAAAILYHRTRNRLLERLPRAASRPSSDPLDRVRVESCVTMAWSFGLIDPVLAAAYSARAYGLALRVGDPSSIALALDTEAAYQAMDDVFDPNVEAMFARGAAMNPGARDAEVAAMRLVDACVMHYQRGDWTQAVDVAARAEQALMRDGRTRTWGAMNIARSVNIVALHFAGRWDLVVERFGELTKNAHERGDRTASTVFKVCIGPIAYMATDTPHAGRAELRETIGKWPVERFDWQRLWATWFDAWYDLYLDEPFEARARLDALWKLFSRSLFGRNAGSTTSLSHLRADAALAVAERVTGAARVEALRAADRERRRLEGVKLGWARAHATQIGAAIAHLRGDDEACVRGLADAAGAYSSAGMAMRAALVRRQRGRSIGGDEGASLVRASELEIVRLGVRSPARVARVLTPGYSRMW